MADLVRARHKGRDSTMSRFFAERSEAEILDEPTHNPDGTVRPMTDANADADAETYEDLRKADLTAAVASRGLDVSSKATKADLVAALEDDDRHTSEKE